MVDENTYTETCACCIVDTERSLYVDLKAAINYTADHLKEHSAVFEKVNVVYRHPRTATKKTYCVNLSALCQGGSFLQGGADENNAQH